MNGNENSICNWSAVFFCVYVCLLLLLYIIMIDICNGFHAITIIQYTQIAKLLWIFFLTDRSRDFYAQCTLHMHIFFVCFVFFFWLFVFSGKIRMDWKLCWIYWGKKILKIVCWLDRENMKWMLRTAGIACSELHFDRFWMDYWLNCLLWKLSIIPKMRMNFNWLKILAWFHLGKSRVVCVCVCIMKNWMTGWVYWASDLFHRRLIDSNFEWLQICGKLIWTKLICTHLLNVCMNKCRRHLSPFHYTALLLYILTMFMCMWLTFAFQL